MFCEGENHEAIVHSHNSVRPSGHGRSALRRCFGTVQSAATVATRARRMPGRAISNNNINTKRGIIQLLRLVKGAMCHGSMLQADVT